MGYRSSHWMCECFERNRELWHLFLWSQRECISFRVNSKLFRYFEGSQHISANRPLAVINLWNIFLLRRLFGSCGISRPVSRKHVSMQDAKKASTSPDVVEISTATEERVKKKPGIGEKEKENRREGATTRTRWNWASIGWCASHPKGCKKTWTASRTRRGIEKQPYLKMYYFKSGKAALKDNVTGKLLFQFGSRESSKEYLYEILDRAIQRILSQGLEV